MQQLTKKSKRTTILGIIGVVVIGALLKEGFSNHSKASVGTQLDQFAITVNKRCPMVIDSTVTLTNCMAILDNRLHFNYQLTQMDKEQVDTVALIVDARQEMINRLKTNPDAAFLKNNEINLTATYHDRTGKYICGVVVIPADLK
jgi:hypothetical protein